MKKIWHACGFDLVRRRDLLVVGPLVLVVSSLAVAAMHLKNPPENRDTAESQAQWIETVKTPPPSVRRILFSD